MKRKKVVWEKDEIDPEISNLHKEIIFGDYADDII